MFKKYRLIKRTLNGLKEDFSWVEIKCNDNNGHYMQTINYINNEYTINCKNANYKEVKKVIKTAVKNNNNVDLFKMK